MKLKQAKQLLRDVADERGEEFKKAVLMVLGDVGEDPSEDPTRVHVMVEDLKSGKTTRMSVSTAAQAIDCVVETLFPGTGRGSKHYEEQLLAGVRVSTPFRCYQRTEEK